MTFNDSHKKKILKFAKKVTKLPGNQTRGDVLDMVLVADCALLPKEQNEAALDLISFFRKEGGAFKNPRINLIKWKADDRLEKSVISYPNLMIGLCLDKKDFTPDDTTMLWVEEPAADSKADEAAEATEPGETDETDEANPTSIVPGPPKHMDSLIKELRKSYNKSKLIILLTSVERDFINTEALGEYLDPMLQKKIVTVLPDGSCIYPFVVPSDAEAEDAITEIHNAASSDSEVSSEE